MEDFDSLSLCLILLLLNIWNVTYIQQFDGSFILMYLGCTLFWAFAHIFGNDRLGKLWIELNSQTKAFLVLSFIFGSYFTMFFRLMLVGLVNYRALDMLINQDFTETNHPTISRVSVDNIGTTKFIVKEYEELPDHHQTIISHDNATEQAPSSFVRPIERSSPQRTQLFQAPIPSGLPSPISTSPALSIHEQLEEEEPVDVPTTSKTFQIPIMIHNTSTISTKDYYLHENNYHTNGIQEKVSQKDGVDPIRKKRRREDWEEEEEAEAEVEEIEEIPQPGQEDNDRRTDSETSPAVEHHRKRMAVETAGHSRQPRPRPVPVPKCFPILPFAAHPNQASHVLSYGTILKKRSQARPKRKQTFDDWTAEETTLFQTELLDSMRRKKMKVEIIQIVKPFPLALKKPAAEETKATPAASAAASSAATTPAFTFGATSTPSGTASASTAGSATTTTTASTPPATTTTTTTTATPATAATATSTSSTTTTPATTTSTSGTTPAPFSFTFDSSQSKATDAASTIPKPTSGKPPPSPAPASASSASTSSVPFGIAFSFGGDSKSSNSSTTPSNPATAAPAFTFGQSSATSTGGSSGGIAFGGASFSAPSAAPAASAAFTFGGASTGTGSADVFGAASNFSFGIGSSSSTTSSSSSSNRTKRRTHKK